MRKAVFLDRDGTLNSDEGHYYIYRAEDFVLNEGVIAGLKILKKHHYLLIVVTNQGGVAKGIYSEADVEKVHEEMKRQLKLGGISIDGIYYCPHHDTVQSCDCRKPSPYMINQAITDFDLDAKQCFMIGDSDRDIEAAKRAGIRAFKIKKNNSIVEICKKIVEDED
ncbi:D-alpha,beta-D-heptose 1,7-bisphosphate phosphatase [Balneicella halophila]|uniref:D,D-heptose 1,7-bisphosphate phosphatase n=1 Tax=Balneicella halophila TaxID=1537566 RepID=A0A7L4UNM0_BALHA|nr:HAD family hydrolase [Balneicella halophila]PVX50780.1 D-alpha,beta-D-heptose 1,7-bisphosphate phosphatase [Balneicella halophila]